MMNQDTPNEAKILICEDDPDLAQLMEAYLQGKGYASDIALSAEEAKQHLENNTYDTITVDISLPGQNGIALILDIKQDRRTENTPIVVVSMSNRSEHYRKLSAKGVETNGWITKPITEAKLISAVQRALDSRK
jgi:CheY-like chemotaxis protein